MSKFHVYHISFFDSLLSGLKANGVSLDKLTQSSYIKRFDMQNPDTYLPLEVSYEFMQQVKKKQGIDCISGEFYGGFQVQDLSDYGQYLSQCPDLFSIFLNAAKYDYLIQSSGKLSLITEGTVSRFSMKHMDAPSAEREISERINTAMMFKAFQFVLGIDWEPLELHITSKDGIWLNKIFPRQQFKLKTSCQEIAFYFKTSELFEKNSYYNPQAVAPNGDLASIEAMTEKVINSLNGYYLPTIDEFSGYFGYSKRTILRQFAAEGASYKGVIEKHLFARSIELLETSTHTVEEVSSMLGYAHPSNFIRAFKRWSNATPYQYQKQLAAS